MDSIFELFQNFFDTLLTWVVPSLFKVILIIAIGFAIKHLINLSTFNFIVKFRNIKRAETLKQIINSTSNVIIIAISLMMILHELGFNVSPILASAGLLGVAFSLGAQNLMKDVINGFFILLEDQFAIGDKVKLGDISGTVEKMNLRTTTLRDISGNTHIIPNSEIKQVSILSQGRQIN